METWNASQNLPLQRVVVRLSYCYISTANCLAIFIFSHLSSGQFAVTIDSTVYKSTTGLFQFRENPQIFSLSPKAVIPSSNASITFEGVSLDAAANPIIRFLSGRAPGDYVSTGIPSLIRTPVSPISVPLRECICVWDTTGVSLYSRVIVAAFL